MVRKKTATVNLTLRLREDLRRQLAQVAKREERSLNEEIVLRLEQSFGRVPADKVLGLTQAMLQQAMDIHSAGAKARGEKLAMPSTHGPLLLSEDFIDAWARDIEQAKEGKKK